MENTILLHKITSEELQEMIREIVRSELDAFRQKTGKSDPDVLLTRSEASEFLKISLTTLWNWTKSGKIAAYGAGNRVYYKKNELLESLRAFRYK